MNIQEFRQKYPDYDDLSDRVLANRLYKKHYSDMDRDTFDERFLGITKPFMPPDIPEEGLPIVQEAKKMQQTISQKLGDDWRVGAAKATAKEMGKDISAGLWAKVWEEAGTENANSLRAILQTAVGLTSGMAGFLAGTVATVANEMKQVVVQGMNAAKGRGFSMNWEEQKAWQKAAESFFEYNVTDPIAQTVLMAVGAIPAGIKSFFDVLSGVSQTDKGKEVVAGIADNLPDIPFIELKKEDIQAAVSASLDAAGVIGELAGYGAVFKTITPARAPKLTRPAGIPKKLPPDRPRPPSPEGGIQRLFAKERVMEKPKKILETIEERKAEQLKKAREVERGHVKGLGKYKEAIPVIREEAIIAKTEAKATYKGMPEKLESKLREIDRKAEREKIEIGQAAKAGLVATKFPEHGLKYDGMWNLEGKKLYSFTPQEGKLKGKTFDVTEPTLKKVGAEIRDVESRFNVPDLTPEQIKAVLRGEEPSTTLESLGFQTTYESAARFYQSVAQDRVVKAKAYSARMRNEALQEVPGNVLDRAAIRYIKEGKYKAYTDSMPEMGQIKPGELFKIDPTSGKLFASLKVGGKEKPAVRQSGFHAILEFQKEIKGYKDVGKTTYEWADPTRWMQEIDQGKFGGPAQRHILWPTRKTTLAKGAWKDTHVITLEGIGEKFRINSKKRDSSLGDIVEHIKSEDIGKASAEILKDPKVAKYLKDYKEPVRHDIIRAGQETRKFADQLLEEQNMARRKRGQKEIDKREFYRPWIIETNLWSRLGLQRSKPKEIMDVPAMSEFIKPNKPFNARAEARTGLLAKYPKEKRMLRLMADYIDTAAKDIFDTNIIHHNKIHAAVLREKQPFAANAVDRWTAEVFAGTGHWFSRGIKRVFPPWMRKPVHVLRRNLTRAVFPLNWTWNMFIQTSSAGLTYLRYGNKSSMYGLKYFTDRKFNRAIKTNAYTHIIKSKWGGRVAYQDVQSSLMRSKKFQTTRIERAENFLNVFTNEIESGLTGHAIAAAYRDGKVRLGLEGRALWEYASEGGAKTQSMYNYGDLPGLLRAKEVGAVAPFQTFAFEVFNTIRELNIVGIRRVVGKTGIYETMSAKSAVGKATISRRLRMLARWTAAIMITNAVAEAAIGRKPWRGPSSFVPFLSYVLNGDAPRGPMPIQYKDDFMRGVKNLIEYGDWRQLRKWAIRYHVPAGVQLERTIQGIEAIAAGGIVTDVRGRPILEIPREEYTAALLKGPWKTPTALKKMREKKKKKTLRTIKVIR